MWVITDNLLILLRLGTFGNIWENKVKKTEHILLKKGIISIIQTWDKMCNFYSVSNALGKRNMLRYYYTFPMKIKLIKNYIKKLIYYNLSQKDGK